MRSQNYTISIHGHVSLYVLRESAALLVYNTCPPPAASTTMARLLPLVAAAALLGPAASTVISRRLCGEVVGDFYQFSADVLGSNETIDFESYRGQVSNEPFILR